MLQATSAAPQAATFLAAYILALIAGMLGFHLIARNEHAACLSRYAGEGNSPAHTIALCGGRK